MLINIGISNNSTRKFACRSYTLKHKWLMVHGVETHIASVLSIMEACALVRVERRVYYRWKKTLCLLKDRDVTASETGSTEMVDSVHDASVEIAPTSHVAFFMQIKKFTMEICIVSTLVKWAFLHQRRCSCCTGFLNSASKAYRLQLDSYKKW